MKAATDKRSPKDPAHDPYVRPSKIEVPPMRPSSYGSLPVGLRPPPDADPHYPLVGMSQCLRLATDCMGRPETGRTLDACWTSVPLCKTRQPWHEPPCCPERCIELYERLRQLGYSQLETNERVGDSYCFTGLKELMSPASDVTDAQRR